MKTVTLGIRLRPLFQPFQSKEKMKSPLNKEDKKSKNKYSILAEFQSFPKPTILLKEP